MLPFFVALALAPATWAQEASSAVHFYNNDRLPGTLDSLTREQLVWKSPLLEKPATFLLGKVVNLTLPGGQPESSARHEASLTLTNGDLVRGQIASVSEDAVELDTWFAGRMKFNRLMIADIKIAEHPDIIYRGPTGLEGWKQTGATPAWTYQGSGFRSSSPGSIARYFPLPDECSIAFDAAWRGTFYMKLVFFSDDLETAQPDAGYEMNFQSRGIQLRSCKSKRHLGLTQNALTLQENDKARIEVRASLKSGKICVYVDDRIIEVWTDPDFAANAGGKGIHFVAQNSSPVQISRIEVAKWDGEIEKMPEPMAMAGGVALGNPGLPDEEEDESAPAPESKPETGRMELRNGDSIAGEVLAIQDGMITVKTPFREVKLPIEKLRSLALKPVSLEICKRYNGDLRGWFPDGSSLVFRMDGSEDGQLLGYSQNFGTARFKTSAFSRLEFNIYDPELEDMRIANGW